PADPLAAGARRRRHLHGRRRHPDDVRARDADARRFGGRHRPGPGAGRGGGALQRRWEPGTRTLVGSEVVIDKDRASALLARELEADLFVMATDVDGVYRDWGTASQRRVE